MLVLTSSLLMAGIPVVAASADKQLQKGIEAYRQNDTDQALEYFIDVLMDGNNEQVAQANKYIDAIHNKIGGIKQPVEVDISFPDQPVQTILNKKDAWVLQAEDVQNQADQAAQNAIDALNTMPQTLTEQIEQRQLANYTQQGLQPVTATQGAVLDNAAVLGTQVNNGAAAARQDLNAIANQYNQQTNQAAQRLNQYGQQVNQAGQQTVGQMQNAAQAATQDMYHFANDYEQEYWGGQPVAPAATVSQPVVTQPVINQNGGTKPASRKAYVSPNLSPTQFAEQSSAGFTSAVDYTTPTYNEAQPAAVAATVNNGSPLPPDASVFTDLTSPAAVQARNLYVAQKLQSMQTGVVSALTAEKGIHLYLRPDGRPDALDIDDGVLFQGNAFRPEAFGTLNHIFELLALTQGARYIILPAGSYTDDVTLSGIRQAMALKSYLTKRGISQGKLYYNMGLVDQEVPTQFSNLKGLSVVFDYDANLPTRMLDNADQETNPLLSMAIVPQCHAIDRSLGEAYAVDFSVLDTVNPISHWTLQVVQHGRNGNYYIVRQLEGFSPVYHQILWNGRKGIIGPELPCGKYTLVLTAVDTAGHKQVLRRRVVVKCAGAAVMGSCETGTCTKQTGSKKTTVLNYKASRLWKKPNRRICVSSTCVNEPESVTPVQQAVAPAQETTDTVSTSTSTYTKTQTVRNVVVDDTSSQSDAVYSSTDEGYAPMPANAGGYAPAEGAATSYEEYTTY